MMRESRQNCGSQHVRLRNLVQAATEENVRHFFEKKGYSVSMVNIPVSQDGYRHTGQAYVELRNGDEAFQAERFLNNTILLGVRVEVRQVDAVQIRQFLRPSGSYEAKLRFRNGDEQTKERRAEARRRARAEQPGDYEEQLRQALPPKEKEDVSTAAAPAREQPCAPAASSAPAAAPATSASTWSQAPDHRAAPSQSSRVLNGDGYRERNSNAGPRPQLVEEQSDEDLEALCKESARYRLREIDPRIEGTFPMPSPAYGQKVSQRSYDSKEKEFRKYERVVDAGRRRNADYAWSVCGPADLSNGHRGAGATIGSDAAAASHAPGELSQAWELRHTDVVVAQGAAPQAAPQPSAAAQAAVAHAAGAKLLTVRAEFDNSAYGPDYLKLRKGDKLRFLGKEEGGWLFGQIEETSAPGVQVPIQGWYPPGFTWES